MKQIDLLPKDLDEAIDLLKNFFQENLEKIKTMSEQDFRDSSHFGAGMFIRNTWFLWWYKDHKNEGWPKEQPPLNKIFNDLGIIHADDMSGILMTSFHRSLVGKDIGLEGQVKYYLDYWKNSGFKQ